MINSRQFVLMTYYCRVTFASTYNFHLMNCIYLKFDILVKFPVQSYKLNILQCYAILWIIFILFCDIININRIRKYSNQRRLSVVSNPHTYETDPMLYYIIAGISLIIVISIIVVYIYEKNRRNKK